MYDACSVNCLLTYLLTCRFVLSWNVSSCHRVYFVSVTNVFEVYRRTCSAEEIIRLRHELSSGTPWHDSIYASSCRSRSSSRSSRRIYGLQTTFFQLSFNLWCSTCFVTWLLSFLCCPSWCLFVDASCIGSWWQVVVSFRTICWSKLAVFQFCSMYVCIIWRFVKSH